MWRGLTHEQGFNLKRGDVEDASSSRRARASEKEKSLPHGGFAQAIDAISQTTCRASYADAETGRAP
jgi:hypothetical protein